MDVRVKTRADERGIELDEDTGVMRVKLKSPPRMGQANEELIEYLSAMFGSARLVSGGKSRRKRVELPQGSMGEIARVLQ